MSLVFVTISTNPAYWSMAKRTIFSIRKYIPTAKILLFTDCPSNLGADKQVKIPSLQWPEATLKRYELILSEKKWLLNFSHVFWIDSDMEIISPIKPRELEYELVGTEHYSFKGSPGTPEESKKSSAYVSKEKIRTYFTGSFQGGETKRFLSLCKSCNQTIKLDEKIGYVARWHDESHLNRYFYTHPPEKTLINWNKKMVIISKGHEDRPSCCGKTLIAIITCDKPEYKAKSAAQQSWVQLLSSSPDYDVEYFDGKRLGVGDDYLSLPHKIKAMCQWAYDRMYDKVLRIDDDTWIDVNQFLSEHYLDIGDYAGCILTPRDGGGKDFGIPDDPPGTWPYKYCAGGGYWLTRRSLKIIIDANISSNVWNEDRWVGHILAKSGITPVLKPDYNFYPRGDVLKMNVPGCKEMKELNSPKIPSYLSSEWKHRIVSEKIERNLKHPIQAVLVTLPEYEETIAKKMPSALKEKVMTLSGERVMFYI